MIIRWKDYIAKTIQYTYIQGHPQTKKSRVKHEKKSGETETLHWNNRVTGWVSTKVENEIRTKRCIPNQKYCGIDCSESCTALSNNRGCKTYNNEFDELEYYYHAYCKRDKCSTKVLNE